MEWLGYRLPPDAHLIHTFIATPQSSSSSQLSSSVLSQTRFTTAAGGEVRKRGMGMNGNMKTYTQTGSSSSLQHQEKENIRVNNRSVTKGNGGFGSP